MKDLGEVMKQAQAMQARMQEAQADLAAREMEGVSGGDMVRLALSGAGALLRVRIDPALLAPGEAEILSDLLVAAHADARRKLEEAQSEVLREIAGPLAGMPGMPRF